MRGRNMDIKDIRKNLEKKQETKEEKIEKDIDIFETALLKSKAESGVKELEKNTKIVTELLNNFANKIPPMINHLDEINQELNVERITSILKKVEDNSNTIIKYSNLILNENKKVSELCNNIKNTSNEEIKNISSLAYREIEELSSNIGYEINQKVTRNQRINIMIIISFLFFIGTAIFLTFSYEKKLRKQADEIYKIHQILSKEQKYWFDKENQGLYIKFKEERTQK